MRNQEWDSSFAQLYPLDFAQFVLCLFSSDAMDGEATLGIVDESEVLPSLLDSDNVHETGRECSIGSDLPVDLNEALHDNGLGFSRVEGIFQSRGSTKSAGRNPWGIALKYEAQFTDFE